nr:hypothetical protein P413_19 [uncultured bacterium]
MVAGLIVAGRRALSYNLLRVVANQAVSEDLAWQIQWNFTTAENPIPILW